MWSLNIVAWGKKKKKDIYSEFRKYSDLFILLHFVTLQA